MQALPVPYERKHSVLKRGSRIQFRSSSSHWLILIIELRRLISAASSLQATLTILAWWQPHQLLQKIPLHIELINKKQMNDASHFIICNLNSIIFISTSCNCRYQNSNTPIAEKLISSANIVCPKKSSVYPNYIFPFTNFKQYITKQTHWHTSPLSSPTRKDTLMITSVSQCCVLEKQKQPIDRKKFIVGLLRPVGIMNSED